jgi:hypothetical protein
MGLGRNLLLEIWQSSDGRMHLAAPKPLKLGELLDISAGIREIAMGQTLKIPQAPQIEPTGPTPRMVTPTPALTDSPPAPPEPPKQEDK